MAMPKSIAAENARESNVGSATPSTDDAAHSSSSAGSREVLADEPDVVGVVAVRDHLGEDLAGVAHDDLEVVVVDPGLGDGVERGEQRRERARAARGAGTR